MTTFSVTLTATQMKAFRKEAGDVAFWIESSVVGRANAAIKAIAEAEKLRRIAEGLPYLLTDDELVMQAPGDNPAPTLIDYKNAFDALLDQVAQQRQYDNRLTIATYAGSTNPEWAAEAQAFVVWRDAALAYMFNQLAAVEAGEIAAPSVAEFVAGIASIEWPQQASA